MAKKLLILLALVALPVAARAAACSQVFTFATGQVLTAANLNANPANEVQCINNIDNTNIGAAGLYASQIIATNASQATFGGSQAYIFPAGVMAPSFITTNGGVNLQNTATANGTSASTVWIAKDGASPEGININVPTSSTNGLRLLVNAATPVFQVTTSGTGTLSGPLTVGGPLVSNGNIFGSSLSNSTTTQSYVPPVYTTSGAAVASTLHGVMWSCTLIVGNCGVTLTGAAVFSSVSSYGCFANTQGSPVATFYISPSGASGFTVTTSSGTGSGVVSGACFGT